jgi:hypothetical protein
MDINRILAELKAEKFKLDAAISALEAVDSTGPRRGTPAAGRRRGRRRMSAAARKRISDAQKARWAKQKKVKRAG